MLPTWQPTASLANLELRAAVLQKIREFFWARQVLEVETPLLCHATVPNPNLSSFRINNSYLQTSPEFAMKRIVAAMRRDVYQICKAFRDDEVGRIHNREFTMLEWYRIGFDHYRLMDEIEELMRVILGVTGVDRIAYKDIFQRELQLDVCKCSLSELTMCAERNNLHLPNTINDTERTFWLQLLFSHLIEPKLGQGGRPIFIYNFPAAEAALAKISPTDSSVAERFELYFKGVELANGFHELTDPEEQRQRFILEQQERAKLNLSAVPLDENFLAALAALPACAGVAIGLDRLLMLVAGANSIADVISFVGNE